MVHVKKTFSLLLAVLFSVLPVMSAHAENFDFSAMKAEVFETTLDNGLKIIILPRHEAPVVSFVTWVNVGGVDDPKEYTGLAHMFEHMAFKGTTDIGSKDPTAEKKLMAREDYVFNLLRKERLKGSLANEKVLARLEEDMKKAIDEAYKVITPNAFTAILEENGGSGLNAYTSRDQTAYIVSLPSNRLELWMALESERFFDPCLREMYREREVVTEERRMTVDNRPMGKLMEEMLTTAYKAHPYGNPLIGHLSDIKNYNREEAKKFFEKYYCPSNMTIAMVGDVDTKKAVELANKYWGRLAKRPASSRIATVEPKQLGERRVILRDKSQPIMIAAWHVPEETHPDMPALEALADLLGQGLTSRLHRRMVRDEQLAVAVEAYSGWPNTKYPSLAIVFCMPAPGKTIADCEKVIYEEIDKFKTDLLNEKDLENVKARAMSGFIMGLKSNMGMAEQLSRYQQLWGDWRELFNQLERINKVTPQDVQSAAQKYFTKDNRTVAILETIEDDSKGDK